MTEEQNVQHNQEATMRTKHADDPISLAQIKKMRHTPLGFFVTRARFTILVIISIIFLGFWSLGNIPLESDPEVKIPIASVTTIYPGASPADIEDLITDKIESKVEELDHLDLVTSSSRLGISNVVVEFEAEADLEESIADLKDKIDEIRGLPDEAEDPIVTEIRVDDYPIIGFSLAANLTERELKEVADEIQDELETIPGVSDAPVVGARQREFAVTVNRASLERFNLSLNAIIGALATSNSDTPLGNLTIDNIDYNLRAVAKFSNLEELEQVVVGNVAGTPILLRDVAEVEDTFSDTTSISRLSIDGMPAQNTLTVQLYKRTGGNILDIVDEAKERIAHMQADGEIPASVSIEESNDYSQFIRKDIRTLGFSGVQAIVLIFITILVAISIREAIVSALAIPMTFFMSFFFLWAFGYTLNSLTLFTLVLALGLLVDNFIVILEGLFDNMRVGFKPRDAALLSVSHYIKPLTAGTLTTISAFVPMLLVSGILGEFLKVMPITMSITLFSSLFISMAIVPSLAAIVMRFKRDVNLQRSESLLEKYLTNKLKAHYRKAIRVLLVTKKYKKRLAYSLIGAFVVSIGLLFGGVIGVQLFPEVDIEFAFIDIELPIGNDLEQTNALAKQVEDYLYTRDDIKNFVTSVGQSSNFGFGDSGSSREHLANISITLVDESERKLKSYEINDEIRDALEGIRVGKITVREVSAGPPTGAPIEARIVGDDLTTLAAISEQLVAELEATEGVIEIESNQEVSPADITFTLDREELSRNNLGVSDVAGFLRTALFGVTATEINLDGEDVDVVVQFSDDVIDSVEEIRNLSISTPTGESVKLSRLADFSFEPALATIRHREFQRAVSVQANLEEGYAPTAVVPEIERKMAEITPAGYSINFGGEVEDIEQSFSELWNAMIVAVLLIIMILVLQFDSFKKPLVILIELPLMLIGVVIGMLVFGLPFSFSVFLGLISLAGIVINDAIVLLDGANRYAIEYGMSPREAIATAGEARMQPIMLTSITTIISIIPLALADEFWFGLSVAIGFGLAFTTLLQLFVVPVVYLRLMGKHIIKRQQAS